jgi:hypothetical protein
MIAARAPLAGQIAVHFQHEGDRMEFEDESGKVRTPKPREVSAKFQIPKNLSSPKSIQQMEESLKTTADDAARQSEGMLFTTIDEAIAETGNAIDARGKPFSPGMILDLLDGVQIDFDVAEQLIVGGWLGRSTRTSVTQLALPPRLSSTRAVTEWVPSATPAGFHRTCDPVPSIAPPVVVHV